MPNTGTLTKPDTGEAIEPTQSKQIFFTKAGVSHVITRAPKVEKTSALGTLETISPGLRYEFEKGYLEVNDALRARDERFFREYADKYPDVVIDKRPAEEWLRTHPSLNDNGPGGFYEIKPQTPESADALSKIGTMLLDGDEGGIVALYEQELDGHKREDVLALAQKSIERFQEARAQAPQADPEQPPAE